jgi:RimJ/RimL family protein N-acetyltransferase
MTDPFAALDRPVTREGERVRLREATLDDADVVDAWAGDTVMHGEYNDFGMPKPPTLAENLADGKRMVRADRGTLLVVRIEDDAIIGDIGWHTVSYGPNSESRALNIGLALIPDARGKGYGTEAQRLMAELLFDLFDIERVEASTDVENIAEQRSLEKAGFIREGVLRRAQFRAGTFHDLVGYSFVRSDLRSTDADGSIRKRTLERPPGPARRDLRHSVKSRAMFTLRRSPADRDRQTPFDGEVCHDPSSRRTP